MTLLKEILTNEYINEHVFIAKPLFSEPKMYIASGDLIKRWYVYYSFLNPKTGKMVRQNSLYHGVNRFKTKRERLEALFFALQQRRPHWKKKTAGTMVGHFNRFIEWLDNNKLLDKNILVLKKRDVSTFLNSLTKLQSKKEKEFG